MQNFDERTRVLLGGGAGFDGLADEQLGEDGGLAGLLVAADDDAAAGGLAAGQEEDQGEGEQADEDADREALGTLERDQFR